MSITAALLAAALASPHAAQASNVFFSGHATGIAGVIKSGEASSSVQLADNQMNCSGLPQDDALADAINPGPIGVQARRISTFTLGRDNTSTADASLQELHLALLNLAIDAAALGSHAEVKCEFVASHTSDVGQRARYAVSGGATLDTLSVNGQPARVSGEPNQVIEVPGVATLIVNEQTRSARSLIVSALHVKMANPSAGGDLVVAYVRAKVTCEP